MTHLIFDAGPLINFSMNGSLPLLEKLKKQFKGDFLITKEVKKEIIDNPENIKRFQLGALKLKQLFNKKIIKYADLTPDEINQLRKKREELTRIANSTFRTKKRKVHLIDKGEAAALSLSLIIEQKTKNKTVLVVDERTTRMLCENPENLRKLLQKKLKTSIQAKKENYVFFKDFKIIRSTELAYIAYKKGLFSLKDSKALGAMLYGLKYNGCSISEEEVEKMKNM